MTKPDTSAPSTASRLTLEDVLKYAALVRRWISAEMRADSAKSRMTAQRNRLYKSPKWSEQAERHRLRGLK